MRFKGLAKLVMAPLRPGMMRIAEGKWDPLFLRSPYVVNAYLRARFEYVTDRDLFGKEEQPQTALEMLRREKGDCEDWAEAARVLLGIGYEPYLFIVCVVLPGGVEKGHAVCVFSGNKGDVAYIHTGGYERRAVEKKGRTAAQVRYDLASHIRDRVYPGSRLTIYGRVIWVDGQWKEIV